ncbi:MAG: hypothetical protein H0W81_11890 [Chloroflexi bacterium]|nr:hypothetical protein [Chloroflexota bacterium]
MGLTHFATADEAALAIIADRGYRVDATGHVRSLYGIPFARSVNRAGERFAELGWLGYQGGDKPWVAEIEGPFSCDFCDGDDAGGPGSNERHHPRCVVAIEEGENARIQHLIDVKRGK